MAVSIDGYLLDAAESESHTFDSDVTEDEVESGGAFTDNIKDKSDVVTITGIVSDTPIGDMVRVRGEASAIGIDGELPFLPSDEAQAKLLALRAAHKAVIVQTSRGTFENMAMTTLDISVSDATGDALQFTASFKKIRIVTNDRVLVKVAAPQLKGKRKFAKGTNVVQVGTIPSMLTTHSGKPGHWIPSKGRFEYDSAPGQVGGGDVVPDSDIAIFQPERVVGPDIEVPEGGLPDTENDTFFDIHDDEWKNTDGTPVTRAQIEKKDPGRGTFGQRKIETSDPEPWYHDLNPLNHLPGF